MFNQNHHHQQQGNSRAGRMASPGVERRVIKEFIEIYRSEPSLWKVRSGFYNNKAIKNQAYRRMVQKLREIYPGADVETVRRKINALRTNYRKEQRKVEASRERSRLTGEPLCVPSLWYYELFHFIGDQEVDMNEMITLEQFEEEEEEGAYEDAGEMSEEFEEEFQFTSENHQQEHRPGKRKREPSWSGTDSVPAVPDCEEAFGRYVAAKLRAIEPNSRMLCERLISEALFRGQTGTLTEKSRISDPPASEKLEE